MDTMGALALATEEPNKELLDDKPHGRSEPLLSITMRKHIVGMSIYQLFWLFFFMYGLPVFFPARYGMTDMCTYYGRDNGKYCEVEAMNR
jgi:Ca2+-transporting ATPase